ncbi:MULTISPECIES: DUF2273 domain-containing protein [Rathayibacter]|uniref:DUF2273 domain-containing protein n=1 Tax=Rathayibacter festucae DSM 15932 TaxID=1328866 RepID=A0A3T0T532_9MICO|nr:MULTISPECIES: DUF2273 domain-containing protein [Rathayibacter]AZZ53649.1 hypothetical protein C1I64_17485 [Rathayibacter festucae DSM 15932]MCJ1698525.1 DUF2273 domain-containing protein [Rathayibacter festucae]ROQ03817.1 small integral membrane protein DUF2273 [Rathayibacter sp. PhB93]ROQ64860.1 small integral membrane protein DUF2273 [Rathayibacter sp. PhB152]ROS23458.1 small integral membrane protein DUF2273 [Rathayibacter sp. PhB127]
MTPSHLGLILGAVLAVTGLVFGFWALLWVALAMAVGYGVGRVVEGKLDLSSLADTLRGRRSS